MKPIYVFLILIFVIIYTAFIFLVDISIDLNIVSEFTVASVFFFSLFSGFFIARQNDRYSRITNIVAERDGLFSYLYRVFNMVPRIQSEISKTIRAYYIKIIEENNWAYNEFHPSDTITRLTNAMSSLTKEEKDQIDGYSPFDGIWDSVLQLQQNRKKIIAAFKERMVIFQWVLIYLFAILTLFSFTLLQTDYFWLEFLKVVFGTAVFLVLILIKLISLKDCLYEFSPVDVLIISKALP